MGMSGNIICALIPISHRRFFKADAAFWPPSLR
ncbi:hypothetical protein AM469_006282, partial [Pseudomonas aeruginosa]